MILSQNGQMYSTEEPDLGNPGETERPAEWICLNFSSSGFGASLEGQDGIEAPFSHQNNYHFLSSLLDAVSRIFQACVVSCSGYTVQEMGWSQQSRQGPQPWNLG
jgi:hypothetical protein